MAKLKVKLATMRAGKSTLLLQINDSYERANQKGLLFTVGDRSKRGLITSRIGIEKEAIVITPTTEIFYDISTEIDSNGYVDYILIDEGQFLTEKQVDDIADIVDYYGIDVYIFGLKVDFKGKLFAGTKRMMEVADEFSEIETKALCWCGKKAIYNIRVDELGNVVQEGDTVQIGDNYETLCRFHAWRGMTKQTSKPE